jgi:NitT/TauT family transport system permease protein
MTEATQERTVLGEPVDGEAVAPAEQRRGWTRLLARKLRLSIWSPFFLLVVAFVAAWQIYAHHHRFVIPTMGAMWHSLTVEPSQYWNGFVVTLREVAIGASGGIVVAFVVAILVAESRIISNALMPFVVVMMMTPIVAIAPALVIAFGFGSGPKYLVAGMVVFPGMVLHSLAGLRNVDSRALDLFDTLDASRWQTFWHLRLRSSLPFVFVGLRIALPVAVVGATVAELSAPGVASGLASLVGTASATGNIVVTWTAIFLLCLMGLALMGLWFVLRKRFLWWDNEAALARRR